MRDPNGRAYNRTAHLVERRKMMQAWANYLDKLKNGADVIPILKASRRGRVRRDMYRKDRVIDEQASLGRVHPNLPIF